MPMTQPKEFEQIHWRQIFYTVFGLAICQYSDFIWPLIPGCLDVLLTMTKLVYFVPSM